MSDRSTGQAPSRLMAVLGPTNTGKTHLAIERMLGHASGMIGLPLRLLAREIYDRIVKLRGARSVALITGEEKIVPPRATYFVCTVEAMPLNRPVEFLAIDEIQLCADRDRGHVFTQRLLHARGTFETMFMGAATMTPLIRRLLPEAEILTRERYSELTHTGPKKLTRLPRRSAIVAFSAENVYAIAELIRRQRGGAAVVMGSLSPRTRNAQVSLYQSGEVDFLVATDAIGMGLNMDVDHVAFAGISKFDGRKTRYLTPQEVGQIAGRAGRYRTNGTFGVTGDCPPLDEDLVDCVQSHAYEPLTEAMWRNSALDFDSLKDLLRSLEQGAPEAGLRLAEPALDELVLRDLSKDQDVQNAVRDRTKLFRLWDVCQLPDFRKTSFEDHVRLVLDLFQRLNTSRIADDWIAPQLKALDRPEGDIDMLSARLAGVRTLAYCANRADWLKSPDTWREQTKALEEKLSDALHIKLMQRFIDRRTSALMKALNVSEDLTAGIDQDGIVTVEGHEVGRLTGLRFEQAKGGSALEDKALRGTAQKVVTPELSRRLTQLANDPADLFQLTGEGLVLWRGQGAGQLQGHDLFSPKVKLLSDMAPEPLLAKARARLEAFVLEECRRNLGPLFRLKDGLDSGTLKGLGRGIAYRLVEQMGVLSRHHAREDIKALTPPERKALRDLGVEIGAFAIACPQLLKPRALRIFAAFTHALPTVTAEADQVKPMTGPRLDPEQETKALSMRGLMRVGRLSVPVQLLARIDEALRTAPSQMGASTVSETLAQTLNLSLDRLGEILKNLGFNRVRALSGEDGSPLELWRRPREGAQPVQGSPSPERQRNNPNTDNSRAERSERPDRKDQRARPDLRQKEAAPAVMDPNSPFAKLLGLKIAAPEPAPRPQKAKKEPKPLAKADKTARGNAAQKDAQAPQTRINFDVYAWLTPEELTARQEAKKQKRNRKKAKSQKGARQEGQDPTPQTESAKADGARADAAKASARQDYYGWYTTEEMGAFDAARTNRRRRRRPRGKGGKGQKSQAATPSAPAEA